MVRLWPSYFAYECFIYKRLCSHFRFNLVCIWMVRTIQTVSHQLFPIVLSLEMWGCQFQNHKIVFLTDNEVVVAIINKTSSKDKTIMKLVRRLVISCLQNNIFFFKAKHVPGKFNVLADRLSRLKFKGALSLSPWLNKTPVQIQANLLHIWVPQPSLCFIPHFQSQQRLCFSASGCFFNSAVYREMKTIN